MAPKRRVRGKAKPGPRGPRRWDGGAATTKNREGGAELMRLLLTWYASCKITAQQFCVACHYCNMAGVKGAAFDMYAVESGKFSGHYQRHLDSILPSPGPLYDVRVPVNLHYSSIRSTTSIPMKYAWDCIDTEYENDPSIRELLEEDPAERTPCILDVPAYKEHPLVLRAEAADEPRPLPIGLYVDGIRYISQAAGRSDTITGFWLVNLVTQKRHLLSSLRHSDECACGCRGWDSIYPLLLSLAWMLRAMVRGESPQFRHDGSAWDDGDEYAVRRKFKTKCVLVWIKGDLMEHAKSFGLAPYSTYYSPCQFCECVSSEMHSFYDDLTSPDGPPWIHREHDAYEHVCHACEQHVHVRNDGDRRALTECIAILKADRGRGRTIVKPVVINGVALRVGDRLDPSEHLIDPAGLASMELPATAVLWRP
eukprot:3872934-Pyramimonas_sp.AAC.1